MLNKLKALISPRVSEGLIPKRIIEEYKKKPDFPYLVSFPRTGSHWLRLILEKYTDRPLLTRSFFEHDNQNFLLYHTHDMDLSEKTENIIYLYRNPTDVIYSIMQYYKQDINKKYLITFWANRYFHHLVHWFYMNKSNKKIFISYEELKTKPILSLNRICDHLQIPFNEEKIKTVFNSINKKTTKQKTTHDKQVVDLSERYANSKDTFKNKYQDIIYTCFNSIEKENSLDSQLHDILFKNN